MKQVTILNKTYYITIDNQVFFSREEAIEHLKELREN